MTNINLKNCFSFSGFKFWYVNFKINTIQTGFVNLIYKFIVLVAFISNKLLLLLLKSYIFVKSFPLCISIMFKKVFWRNYDKKFELYLKIWEEIILCAWKSKRRSEKVRDAMHWLGIRWVKSLKMTLWGNVFECEEMRSFNIWQLAQGLVRVCMRMLLLQYKWCLRSI